MLIPVLYFNVLSEAVELSESSVTTERCALLMRPVVLGGFGSLVLVEWIANGYCCRGDG